MASELVREYETSIRENNHPYMSGAWAPMHREYNATDMEVIGTIPTDIDGVYIRNTENPVHRPLGMYHPFEGDGMLHMISFKDGKATYRNRFIQTNAFREEQAAGEALWSGWTAIPNMSKRPGEVQQPGLKDASSTDVIVHAGKVITTYWQCGQGYKLDPYTLEDDGTVDWCPEAGISAHTKLDENTGELLFFNYSLEAPYMHYGLVDADGNLEHYIPVDLPGPRMPHDMAFTENFAIVNDFPMFYRPDALEQGIHIPMFDKTKKSRFGIIPRKGKPEDIRWFEAEPTYVLHWLNAWEEGDEIILDGYFQEDPFPAKMVDHVPPKYAMMATFLDLTTLGARLHRWRFNLKTGETREEKLDDEYLEFGMFNQKYAGKPYRYAYSAKPKQGWFLFEGLVKHDLKTGEKTRLDFGENRYGSEAPFVPRVGATEEDDGYLVSFITDMNTNTSEAVLVDARRIEDGPVCRIMLPERIPSGTHSTWANGEDIRKYR
ncbi:carotenoid oxygenase family protein [Kordiimonas lacus]|uniref:Dioxygenase n=1 Tax=Kordiimonas lacus TaxID=637679 RepID=A0A1G6YNH8_9PROT|nr:carotenoid oxygenase family protein [Kordiimonas lacus]SDD91870.1 carotenoid cleavage dioxygenase [Kordiimonas lacus]